MEFKQQNNQGVVILTLLGDKLEINEIRAVKEKLFKLTKTDVPDILLNMEKIERIDSSGIGVFISFWKTFGAHFRLYFCNLQPHIKQIFYSANLNQVFRIYPNTHVALSSLQKRKV